MSRITFFVLMLMLLSLPVRAQDNVAERHVPPADTARLSRLRDSLNKSPMFSYRYQRFFDSMLAIMPWNAYWWQQKGMPLMKEQKYEAGMACLDSAVKYDTKYHHYLEYRAFMKCIFQKSYRASICDFNQMLSFNGDLTVMDHSYNFYKGICYLQLNQLDSCEYCINLSIDERRKANGEEFIHYLDWFYLGIARYEKEDYAGALALFDKSLAVYKQFSDAQYYKARCLGHMNKPAEALECIKGASINANLGYTINEDNAVHEHYPYQVKKESVESTLKYLEELNKGMAK